MVEVVSKFLIIRPLPLSLPFFTQFPPFSKSHFPRLFSLSATKSLNPQPYGPTLHKLTIAKLPFLSKDGPGNDDHEFDPDDFTRVFDVSALRVPSKDCFSLENRLRGHLLNWPRIRNIARVPGDEIEEEFKSMLPPEIEGEQEEEEGSLSLDRLNRRIYGKAESDGERLSPVLHREELVKTFNSKGYVNFRNLAKMSRPKKKKVKFGTEKNERVGKSNFSVVEVVEEIGDDFSRLLGDEFKGGSKWRGSTRLLLLDEAYASTHVEELPEAVKAAIHDYNGQSSTPTIELVRCKLTLFYGYWPMNEILESVLPDGMIVPSAFETVGHIAHLNLRDEHSPYKKLIAKVVLDKNSPKIQTVVNKVDAIDNDYRTMQLEVLAGNHSLVTTVMENGLRFQLDLATVYWNSRLATERQTLLNGFTRDDILCDVFSGVGPIALAAAKKVKRVYANDLNPQAVDYLERNSVINKLERKIKVFNMDGRRFINAMFTSEKGHSITQVVMNLPMDAAEYLDAFRGIFRNEPKGMEFSLPRIHVYGFSKAEDPEFDFQERIRIAMSEVAFEVKMRKVRLVAPGKWMLCASFILPRSVAFGKPVLDM